MRQCLRKLQARRYICRQSRSKSVRDTATRIVTGRRSWHDRNRSLGRDFEHGDFRLSTLSCDSPGICCWNAQNHRTDTIRTRKNSQLLNKRTETPRKFNAAIIYFHDLKSLLSSTIRRFPLTLRTGLLPVNNTSRKYLADQFAAANVSLNLPGNSIQFFRTATNLICFDCRTIWVNCLIQCYCHCLI